MLALELIRRADCNMFQAGGVRREVKEEEEKGEEEEDGEVM